MGTLLPAFFDLNQTFTFRATEAGATAAGFSYDQPWEDDDKGAWTLSLAIVVG